MWIVSTFLLCLTMQAYARTANHTNTIFKPKIITISFCYGMLKQILCALDSSFRFFIIPLYVFAFFVSRSYHHIKIDCQKIANHKTWWVPLKYLALVKFTIVTASSHGQLFFSSSGACDDDDTLSFYVCVLLNCRHS